MYGERVSERYVLVIDAGTTGPKCVVFDGANRIVGFCRCDWSYLAEEDASPLSVSFDTRAVWRNLCDLIAGGMADAGVSSRQIAAVAVTGQRQAVVFLDDDGNEIYAGPNMDLRAVFEGAALDQEMGDRIYEATGHLPSFLFAAAKLRWFQAHRPGAYDKIASALTLADWVVYRLTGVQASEHTLAAEAGLLDIRRRKWCSDLLDDVRVFSRPVPLVPAGMMAGNVPSQASKDTGLRAGTPVAVAGADTQCGLLGMGVAQPGLVGVVAGWSAAQQMVTSTPVISPDARTWAGCFPKDDMWVLESSPGDTGNSYRWLAETVCGGSNDAYEQMDRMATEVPLGSEGVVAFLGPRRMDMANVGMRPGGFIFPVPLTHSEIGRANLVRACLEAICFSLKANLGQIEELTQERATGIAVGGGMVRTATWTRILADVLGREIGVSTSLQVSALGACLCARTALGEFGSLEEATSNTGRDLQVLDPDPLRSAQYGDLYQNWLEVSGRLDKISL